jgi:hypothetical protein
MNTTDVGVSLSSEVLEVLEKVTFDTRQPVRCAGVQMLFFLCDELSSADGYSPASYSASTAIEEGFDIYLYKVIPKRFWSRLLFHEIYEICLCARGVSVRSAHNKALAAEIKVFGPR